MAVTPTPTQAEANLISGNLYAGLPPPTCAPDGSPLQPGAAPGSVQEAAPPPPPAHRETPGTHRETTHRETARAR